ncbi:hypothetical protein PoB_005561100 [Plakobranchus ocellatus]|uniref:Uncharacterized protein n=1 Tax=Plakobranchus ocellatus TaxID=259542 RepID=A0AAV4C8R4_9GAST|nr:hypothetical protein PoB_005561100 [Plakobranchus ocellatus]
MKTSADQRSETFIHSLARGHLRGRKMIRPPQTFFQLPEQTTMAIKSALGLAYFWHIKSPLTGPWFYTLEKTTCKAETDTRTTNVNPDQKLQRLSHPMTCQLTRQKIYQFLWLGDHTEDNFQGRTLTALISFGKCLLDPS